MLLFMSFMYSRKRTGPRTEPCGTPDVIHVLSDRAPLTETLVFGVKEILLSSFWCFQLFHRRLILIGGVYEGLCQRLWQNQAGWHLSVSCYL